MEEKTSQKKFWLVTEQQTRKLIITPARGRDTI
jgi:hypothetical protein